MKKNLKFPEISLKEQQSIFGAFGGSGSDDFIDGGMLDEVDLGTIGGGSGGSDSGGGSAGDWNDWANDGSSPWGDGGPGDDYYGGGGSGGNYDSGEVWWALNNLDLQAEVLENASIASNAAQELAQYLDSSNLISSLHDGYADAFRHSLWSAMNAEDIGFDNAIDIGQAHENSGDNTQAEIDMDLNNNAWGAYFSENNDNWTIEDFLDAFNKAIKSGDIIITNTDTIPEDLDIDFDFSDNNVYGPTTNGGSGGSSSAGGGSSSAGGGSLGEYSDYDYEY